MKAQTRSRAVPGEMELRRSIRSAIKEYARHYIDTRFNPDRPVVHLHEPTFAEEEIWEAVDSLLSTRVTMGEKVRRFEKEFCDTFGLTNGVSVNSGSSANLLAVAALCNPVWPGHWKPGDEVLVPALCWSTTAWPLIQHGLVPVVVDIDPKTMNVDPNEVERAIGPKTRGLMLVHVYGNPCAMDAIAAIAKKRSLTLIEDCCEATGSYYRGRHVGTFGQVGTFSFYYSHHITTLEGGMCVTENREVGELMRVLRAHGWVRDLEDGAALKKKYSDIDPKFLFVNIGYNFRITELQGGFGLAQLKKVNDFLRIRRENAQFWRAALKRYEGFFDFQEETPGGKHSWFGFPMMVKDKAPFTVLQLRNALAARGIESRPLIAGNIAAQPGLRLYPHRVVGDLANANRLMKSGFTFGNHQAIDKKARAYVVDVLEVFLKDLK